MKKSKLTTEDYNRIITKILSEDDNNIFFLKFRSLIGNFIEKISQIESFLEKIEGFGWFSLEFDMETNKMNEKLIELFVDPIDKLRIDFYSSLDIVIEHIRGRGPENFLEKINKCIYSIIKEFNSVVENSKLLVATIQDENLNAQAPYVVYILGLCDGNLFKLKNELNNLYYILSKHTI